MNQDKFETEIMELYFGERHEHLTDLAKRHGVSFSEAQIHLKQIERISSHFKTMPQHQASQIALNKISILAGEAAEKKSWSFFSLFNQPLYSSAAAAVVLVFGLLLWQNSRGVATQKMVISATQKSNVDVDITGSLAYHQVIKRLLKTPLDKDSYEPLGKLQVPKVGYLTSGVSNVSLGHANGNDSYFIDDDVINRVERNAADADALKMLFFRARKLEKLGHYQDALHDYLLIAENTQKFEHELAIHISIANCYAQLGDKDTALSVLESYRQSYGSSDDLNLQIDGLKSETF